MMFGQVSGAGEPTGAFQFGQGLGGFAANFSHSESGRRSAWTDGPPGTQSARVHNSVHNYHHLSSYFMPPCTSVSKRRLRRCTAPSNPHLRVGRALHLGPSASIPTRRAALTAPSCSLARWATRLLSHWRLLPPGRSSGRIGRPAGPRGPAGGGSPGRHAQVATPRKSFAGGRRASADARGRATRRRPERDLSPSAAASPIGRARGRPRRSRRIRARRPIDRPPSRSGGSHE